MPECWDLVSRHEQFPTDKYVAHRRVVYGRVERKTGGFQAGGPAHYDEQTDLDAWGIDALPDVETAMRAVEERYSVFARLNAFQRMNTPNRYAQAIPVKTIYTTGRGPGAEKSMTGSRGKHKLSTTLFGSKRLIVKHIHLASGQYYRIFIVLNRWGSQVPAPRKARQSGICQTKYVS